MSTIVNPHVVVNPDTETDVELAIRVPVTRSNARWGIHLSNEVRTKQGRVAWPQSESHPEGAKFWGWFAQIDEQNYAKIDQEALEYYEEDGGFPMIKIVARCKPGQKVVATTFNSTYRIDDTEPIRPDGRTLFSVARHKFGVGHKHFLFVISLCGNREKATLRIDQVTLKHEELGKFHLIVQKRFERKNVPLSAIIPIIESQEHVRDLKPRIEETLRSFKNDLSE